MAVVMNANASNANAVPPARPAEAMADVTRWRQLHDAPAIVWSSPGGSAHLTLSGVVVPGRGTAGAVEPLRTRGTDGGCVVMRPGSDGTVLEAGLTARGLSLSAALGATPTRTSVVVLRIPTVTR